MTAQALTGAGNLTSTTSTSAAGLTGSKPASVADGDLLLAAFYHRNASGTITAPAGWTAYKTESGNGTMGLFGKPIPSAAGESATDYAFSSNQGSARCVLIIFRVTGAAISGQPDAAGATSVFTGTSSLVLPSVTAVSADCLLIGVGTCNTSALPAPTYTPPSPMTTVQQTTVAAGASTSTLIVGQEDLLSSGATGTRTLAASPNAANSGGFLVTIESLAQQQFQGWGVPL